LCQEFSSSGFLGDKGSPLLFKYKIKHKIANKDSKISYIEDQGRNRIKLPELMLTDKSKQITS